MAKLRQLADPTRPLTAKQVRFAHSLIACSGDRTAAAKMAGYPARSAQVMGSRLGADPRIRSLLTETADQMIAGAAPEAAKTMMSLLKNKSGYVRLQAAQDILNRNKVGTDGNTHGAGGFVFRIDLGGDGGDETAL